MKRLFCILLIAALLCACAGTAPTETPEQESQKAYGADFAARVAEAWDAAGYLKDMARYSDEDLLDYYGIDRSVCKCGVGYSDAVGYTTEAIVVVAEEATAIEIEALLSEHLAAQRESFRDYDPEALKIAENAVLERDGGMVVLIVSPDAQAMLDTLRGVTP